MANKDELPKDERKAEEFSEPVSSHPVSTGFGAAVAGAVGAAIGGAIGGPIGAAVGIAAGAALGGAAGHAVADAVDPDAEEAYWRERHKHEPHAAPGHTFEDYHAAYQIAYTRYDSFAKGTTFDAAEAKLRENYEAQKHPLPWAQARLAARAAWDRAARGEAIRKLRETQGDLLTARKLAVDPEARGDRRPILDNSSALSGGATGAFPKPGGP